MPGPILRPFPAHSPGSTRIWTDNAVQWGVGFPLDAYVAARESLMSPDVSPIPSVAWALTHATADNEDDILASCTTHRMRALLRPSGGIRKGGDEKESAVREIQVHAVAFVFSHPRHRGKGHGARLMRELAESLSSPSSSSPVSLVDSAYSSWTQEQSEAGVEAAPRGGSSILYSSIGRDFYARHGGWTPSLPGVGTLHVELPAIATATELTTRPVTMEHVGALCTRDEAIVRESVAAAGGREDGEAAAAAAAGTVVILPSEDLIKWQMIKEDVVASYFFPDGPSQIRGAIVGDEEGRQAWLLWTQRYRGIEAENNELWIQRLVVEGVDELNDRIELSQGQMWQIGQLLAAAQEEAQRWNIGRVVIREPTRAVKHFLETRPDAQMIERADHVPAGLWYDASGERMEHPTWINHGFYAYC